MILADTGPLVALFDPADPSHAKCKLTLRSFRKPLCTTIPVLTEAFHMLGPASHGSETLRAFVSQGGAQVWFMDSSSLERAFELMDTYRDHPMDLADASLIVAGEVLRTRRVFTLDRRDFESYRIRIGYKLQRVEIA